MASNAKRPTTAAGELIDRVGVRLHPTIDGAATLTCSPAIIRNGSVLSAALMLTADVAAGIRLHEADVTRVLTGAFSLRHSVPCTSGTITACATRLFQRGRRVVDRVTFRNDTGDTVATARIAFVVQRGDETHRGDIRARYHTPLAAPIAGPLIDAAGIAVVDAASGRVSMPLTAATQREGGMLQGGFVTLVGEASALVFGEHASGTSMIVQSLDVEFLTAVTGDRVVADANWLGAPGRGEVEVVLRGDGVDDPAAVFTVGLARAEAA